MKDLFKKVLGTILPGERVKTRLSAWILALGVIEQYVPGISVAELVNFIINNPSKAGLVGLVIGLLDKWAKGKGIEAVKF